MFCYGEFNWEFFDIVFEEKFGFVYVLVNYGKVVKYDFLESVLGKEVVGRWKVVISMIECL